MLVFVHGSNLFFGTLIVFVDFELNFWSISQDDYWMHFDFLFRSTYCCLFVLLLGFCCFLVCLLFYFQLRKKIFRLFIFHWYKNLLVVRWKCSNNLNNTDYFFHLFPTKNLHTEWVESVCNYCLEKRTHNLKWFCGTKNASKDFFQRCVLNFFANIYVANIIYSFDHKSLLKFLLMTWSFLVIVTILKDIISKLKKPSTIVAFPYCQFFTNKFLLKILNHIQLQMCYNWISFFKSNKALEKKQFGQWLVTVKFLIFFFCHQEGLQGL